MTDMIGYDWLSDLTTLIKSFKEYLKKPKNMDIVNDILINCRKLNKVFDKIK